MFRIITNLMKGMLKSKLGIHLSGAERFMLTSMYSKVDRIASMLVAGNVHPQLIDSNYDFVRLTSSVEANLELFEKLLERFPNFDGTMTANWLGLAGCGQVEMGTTMRILPLVEPSPAIYALDRNSLEELPMPEMKGYLEKQIQLSAEVQDRYPEIISPPIILGSWDLAMLLRGEKLISDFRLFKDFKTSKDWEQKKKIQKKGDPNYLSRLLDFTTEASIAIGNLYKENGVKMLGMVIVNQYANPPIMSPFDFTTYIYPYVERVWKEFKKYRPTAGYMPPSPNDMKKILQYPALSGIACFNNYMFPQNEYGLTAPEYDEEMITYSKEIKVPYTYIIHGKFLRDGTEKEIEAQIARVCKLAVEAKAPLSIGLSAVPLGTKLSKVDLIIEAINKYGVYK